MKNRTMLLIALLIVVAFVAGFSAAGRQKWEYQETCTGKDLNELGRMAGNLSARPAKVAT